MLKNHELTIKSQEEQLKKIGQGSSGISKER